MSMWVCLCACVVYKASRKALGNSVAVWRASIVIIYKISNMFPRSGFLECPMTWMLIVFAIAKFLPGVWPVEGLEQGRSWPWAEKVNEDRCATLMQKGRGKQTRISTHCT